MAILRKKTRDNFTVITNEVFKDRELSMKGRGLLCTMLSLPDMWEFSEKGLEALFPDGQYAVRSAIKELTELGYLKRNRVRSEEGQFKGWEWIVCDHRMNGRDPQSEPPNLGNPNLADQPQLRTKESRTNESRTEGWKELTNSDEQDDFGNQLSRAREYEMETATESDVLDVVSYICSKNEYRKSVNEPMMDGKTQCAFSKEPLDSIMTNVSANAEEVKGAIDRLLYSRPSLYRKPPSYLLRDCEDEICEMIEDARTGTRWSKW